MQSRVAIDLPSWLAWFVNLVQVQGLQIWGCEVTIGLGIERIPLG